VAGSDPARITLAAQPASVGAARRFVQRVIEADLGAHPVVDDAVLVTSELVANAVLHAGGPVTVDVAVTPGPPARCRIEVVDDSPVVPAIREYGAGASTGRGLALIARIAARWGIDPADPAGKAVWVELEGGAVRNDGAVAVPRTTLVAPAGVSLSAEAGLVRFLRVPVSDYLRLQEQNDAVLRELELLAFTADHDDSGDPSSELVEVIESARRFSNIGREGFRQEVMAAAERGESTIDLQRISEPGGVVPAADFVALFERAEELAGRGELLIGPADEGVYRLRRWFVSEMSRQLLEGQPPRPFAQPPEDAAR
jgi:anti-sigma regulatory factor (Ser/Thr protein kinase)